MLVLSHQVTECIEPVLAGEGLGDARLETLDASVGHLLGAGQCHFLDGFAGGFFDGLQQPALPVGGKQNGFTGASGPTRATDAVHVGLHVVGDIVVEHVGDALHIQPACGHVSGHEDIELAVPEAPHRFLPLGLGQVTVQRRGGVAAGVELLGQFRGGGSGADEDDHAVEGFHLQNPRQRIQLVQARHHPHSLSDGFSGGVLHLDDDLDRVLQVVASDALDGRRQGGGKQDELVRDRGFLQNPFHIIDEAHAQHFIGLVQYQAAQGFEFERPASHVVHDAPGGAHDHLWTALQPAQLGAVILTSVDGQHVETLQVCSVALKCLGYLDGQFAGGRQHQHLRGAFRQVEAGQ